MALIPQTSPVRDMAVILCRLCEVHCDLTCSLVERDDYSGKDQSERCRVP